jgi:retinol dehydrogenase 12
VTGANCGLGLEAARHFVRLNASKVILACRSVQKGELAKTDIESSTNRKGVVEVWQVDLASFASVREFCAQAWALERLDIVIENAGIATGKFEQFEGYESTITVNVISTFLMSLMFLPKLRESASKFNITPHLTIVSSDAHQMFAKILSVSTYTNYWWTGQTFVKDLPLTSLLLSVMRPQNIKQTGTTLPSCLRS